MICYRDMTFCSYYTLCKKWKTCDRALTPEVLKEANEWWKSFKFSEGISPGVPIARFGNIPNCMEPFKSEDDEDGK